MFSCDQHKRGAHSHASTHRRRTFSAQRIRRGTFWWIKTQLGNFVGICPAPPVQAKISRMRLQHAGAPTVQRSTLRAAGTIPNRSTPKEVGKQDVRSLQSITFGLKRGKVKSKNPQTSRARLRRVESTGVRSVRDRFYFILHN